MAIKFFNIKTKETRLAETEPLISALWASSDRSPNITQGQDFGWRLAPEVVVELKRIKADPTTIDRLAARYNVPSDAVDEKLVLQYISDMTSAEDAPEGRDEDYSDEYNAEIRRIEEARKAGDKKAAKARKADKPNPDSI